MGGFSDVLEWRLTAGAPWSRGRAEGPTPAGSHSLDVRLRRQGSGRQSDAWGRMSFGHLLSSNYPAADKKIK